MANKMLRKCDKGQIFWNTDKSQILSRKQKNLTFMQRLLPFGSMLSSNAQFKIFIIKTIDHNFTYSFLRLWKLVATL